MTSGSQSFFNITSVLDRFWAIVAHEVENFAPRVIVYSLVLSFIVYLWAQRSYKPKSRADKIDKETEEELIKDFTPEPLVPEHDNTGNDTNRVVLTSFGATHIKIEGRDEEVVNFATHNFLGVNGKREIAERSKQTVEKYGVGSCGPRGFYGTIDVHLDLEDKIAKFMGTSSSIIYSFGWCTISSVIPAFSKQHDLLVCDENCNYAIQSGALMSRSRIVYFKHNDMAHLEQILKDTVSKDKGRPVNNRRFIICQGVYENHGDIAPLDKIVELKNKYCFRVMIDDSFGVGVLGKTGRGTIEHFDLAVSEFDCVCATLENAFGSVGGFCTGSNQVVEHQRLGGSAYVFSASLPPYVSTASICAFEYLERNGSKLLPQLGKNADLLSRLLEKSLPKTLVLEHSQGLPIMHVRVKRYNANQYSEVNEKFKQVVNKALEKNLAVARPQYTDREYQKPSPSIKIMVSAEHSKEDIEKCAAVLCPIFEQVFPQE